jgi:hypothetical protein
LCALLASRYVASVDPSSAEAGSPDWVRAAVRSSIDELRRFFATAWAFMRQPRRFAREWTAGVGRPLNPLAFFATTLAIVGPIRLLATWLGLPAPGTATTESRNQLLGSVVDSVTPFLHYVGVGAFVHGLLRIFGTRRPLRDTVAMAFYAGGSFASAIEVLLLLFFSLLGRNKLFFSDVRAVLVVPLVLPMFAFYVGLGLSLVGLNEGVANSGRSARAPTVGAALLITWLASGLFFGSLKPRGTYGLHPVITYSYDRSADPPHQFSVTFSTN